MVTYSEQRFDTVAWINALYRSRGQLMKRAPGLLILGCCLTAFAVRLSSAHWSSRGVGGQNANTQQPNHLETKIDPKLFDEYVGQYSFLSDPEFVLSFWREGDKFLMQATSQGRIEIFPESDTRFFLKIISAQATFVRV